MNRLVIALALAAWSAARVAAQGPITTAFTYQGELRQSGAPASGVYDLRFRLYDALSGGSQVGAELCADNISMSSGHFTMLLDFGAQYAGQQRFLEVDVRQDTGADCSNPAGYTTLSPRQELTITPNAAFALAAASASNASALNGQTPAFYQDASNLSAGSIPDGRLSGSYSSALIFSNAANSFAGSFSGDGSGLTGIPWSNITGAPDTVLLQPTSPGSAQSGNANITGTLIAGGFQLGASATPGQVLTADSTGVGTWQNAPGLTLPYSATGSSATQLFSITNSSSAIFATAARFESLGTSSRGLFATSPGVGIFGQCTGTGYAVFGNASSSSALSPTYGVYGQNFATSGAGVAGVANASAGTNYGVSGTCSSPTGNGVYGFNSYTGNDSVNIHAGGFFECDAVFGQGVYGKNTGAGAGVYGVGLYGVYGYGFYGVSGQPSQPGGYGVYCNGDFVATGTKAFQIDHPLDPENKYLNHYCAEGPEPLNVYRGNITLDDHGQAWVALPDYFDAINRDPSYTLTPIGAPAPALHIAQELADRRFLIAGGAPGQKVSWRVEALRNDRFVQTYGAPVEQDKPADLRGTYLQPELYGQPKERAQFRPPAAVAHP